MDWLKAILGVVKTAAPIAANIVLPGSGSIVGGLMNEVLKEASGYSDENLAEMTEPQKAELISKNPELMVKLEEKAMELEATIAKEKTKNMEQVAGTMQAELKDGKWYQRAWRPFNGFMFPIAVLGIYLGLPIWNAYHPLALFVVEVPQTLWLIWGGILGVAVYGRNQEKKGNQGPKAAGLVRGLLEKLTK